MKTHKTGSSTVLSVLNRFADINNLEVALPFRPNVLLDWPHKFKESVVDKRRLRNGRADILCNHAVFTSKQELDKVVHPNSKYITIVRDPAARFESQFFFENFDQVMKLENTSNPILEFQNSFIKLTDPNVMNWDRYTRSKLPLLRNGMLFDLTGINTLRMKDEEFDYTHQVSKIMDTFDLVMITEYFDESLVLLQELLGWTVLDIVYAKKRVRNVTHSELLTAETKLAIYENNKGDLELYGHFKHLFLKQIDNYKNDFQRAVEVFRRFNTEINNQCHQSSNTISVDKLRKNLRDLELDKNDWKMIGKIDPIHPCFCSKLHRDENEYLDYLWEKFPPYHYLPSAVTRKWLNC